MTRLARAHDWPERFAAFIDSRRHEPFAWGRNDCGLFAADGVLAITGVDLGAEFRGYNDETGARLHVHRWGGMRGLAHRLFMKHVGLAQRGDVILAGVDGAETYGLVSTDGRWCAPGPGGLVFRYLSDALYIFEY